MLLRNVAMLPSLIRRMPALAASSSVLPCSTFSSSFGVSKRSFSVDPNDKRYIIDVCIPPHSVMDHPSLVVTREVGLVSTFHLPIHLLIVNARPTNYKSNQQQPPNQSSQTKTNWYLVKSSLTTCWK